MKKTNFLTLILFTFLTVYAQQRLVDFIPSDTSQVPNTIKASPAMNTSVVFEANTHLVKQTRKGDPTIRVDHAPNEHDWMWYVPSKEQPNNKGLLVMNHERSVLKTERPLLGEGGSMSIVNVMKKGDSWMIDESGPMKDTSISVDFSPVGWTTINCGGAYLPNGLMLTGEEIFDIYRSNKAIATMHDTLQDAFGYNGSGMYTIPANVPEFGGKKIPMHQNFGYMTQIDANTGKAVNKSYHMGRFSHESGTILEDGKSMILTDDYASKAAILFKFVADTAYIDDQDKYYSGNLYAFKQNPGSYEGTWVMIDRNLDSLVVARGVAGRKGATMFARLEWADIDPLTGYVYVAETGMDNQNVKTACSASATEIKNTVCMDFGATIPKHWNEPNDSISWDPIHKVIDIPFGCVIVIKNALTDKPIVEPYLKGGYSSNGNICFANVDGISIKQIGNKSVGIFQEDLIPRNRDRVSAFVKSKCPYIISEAFLIDLSITNPKIDDLKLFFAGSCGAEVTGACFTPDAQTIFINNQHPKDAESNDPLYARTSTIALTLNTTMTIDDILSEKVRGLSFRPLEGKVVFSKAVSGSLYQQDGRFIKNLRHILEIDPSDLNKGIYYFKTTENEVSKIVHR